VGGVFGRQGLLHPMDADIPRETLIHWGSKRTGVLCGVALVHPLPYLLISYIRSKWRWMVNHKNGRHLEFANRVPVATRDVSRIDSDGFKI